MAEIAQNTVNKIAISVISLLLGALITGVGSWLAFGANAATKDDLLRIESKVDGVSDTLSTVRTQVAVLHAQSGG